MRSSLVVVAAVIERGGRFLVTRRLAGAHLGGCWEFPGGKCDPGETLESCLTRELREELGLDARVGERLLEITHAYADRDLQLHFFRCAITTEPFPLLGQEMRWASRDELRRLEFPPADAELIERLCAGA
jgi:mutator protein MutT